MQYSVTCPQGTALPSLVLRLIRITEKSGAKRKGVHNKTGNVRINAKLRRVRVTTVAMPKNNKNYIF